MIKQYLTVKQDGQFEIEVKKSRFICTLARVESEEEAKTIIERIRKEHWKATHNCVAFVIGERNEIQRSNDDGEPSGTAGIPMLEVLKKRGLINTLAIVTRYFGGTKLGAGGLIRAYGSAVSEALNHIGIVEGKLQQEMLVTLDYTNHGKLKNFLDNAVYTVKDTQYTDIVTVSVMVDDEEVDHFGETITNLLNGQETIKKGEKTYSEKEYHP